WPNFHATLADVTLAEWGTDGRSPVIRAERVEIDLSAIAALRGEVSFSRVRLFRPTLYVRRHSADLYLPPMPSGGRIARSIQLARAAVKANPASPDPAAFATDPFGTIEFSDGRIVTIGDGKESDLITGIAGNVSWAALNRAASLSATGIWRGENVALTLASDQPLMLFAGGNAPVSLGMKSAPLTVSFDGTANISEGAFVDGTVKFSSPSLRRMLEWSRADVAARASIGSISVSSKVSGNAQRLKFDHAEIALDGNPGIGALDVSIGSAVPGISGTLAFDSIDLHSFLAAFTPLASLDNDNPGPPAGTGLIQGTNVDLRLSAVKASAGSVTLANVAATAQVKQGLSVFDVSDASAFGGNLQAGVRIDRKPDGNHVELRLHATDMDGAQISKAFGLTRLFPQATGSASLTLKGIGRDWSTVLDTGDGQISVSFGAGKVPGIDLAGFVKRAKSAGFFPLSAVGKGTLALDRLDLKATMSAGVATLDKADAKSGDQIISFAGLVPFVDRGLALSGTIYPVPKPAPASKDATKPAGDAAQQAPAPAPATDTRPTAAFFVGGSWSAPYISPIYPSMMPE
ncbi:MAG: AsmA family protein, partial [Rhizobiales bacterium]|nr:AsmA family protein [Hyphomicrobiales bacterium]